MQPTRTIARFAATTALLLGLVVVPAQAHDDDLGRATSQGSALDGTWRLVEPRLGAGFEEYKFVSAVSEDHAWMVGGRGKFDVDLEGARWRHRGVVESGEHRTEVDEVWERMR